jgi:hypothetical protein
VTDTHGFTEQLFGFVTSLASRSCRGWPISRTSSSTSSIRSHSTQVGLVRKSGTLARRAGADCTGCLTSFVRRTEVFVLSDPRASRRP